MPGDFEEGSCEHAAPSDPAGHLYSMTWHDLHPQCFAFKHLPGCNFRIQHGATMACNLPSALLHCWIVDDKEVPASLIRNGTERRSTTIP